MSNKSKAVKDLEYKVEILEKTLAHLIAWLERDLGKEATQQLLAMLSQSPE